MTPAAPFRSKLVATLAAALGGTFGLHRFYLDGPRRLRPWLHVAFAWTLVPTFVGIAEALVFALTPDERWDARWNAGSPRASASGWPVVAVAILAFFGGATLLMTLLSFAIGRLAGSGETFF